MMARLFQGYNRAGMETSADSLNWQELSVPLFPLPNVILFPGVILPLHIFEQRYRVMTADALIGDKLIAMALLRPGWEKNYHDRPAIEPVVCVGKIVSWEQLDDGRYNFLLRGIARAEIVREKDSSPYRRAELSLLKETSPPEEELFCQRRRLLEMFHTDPLASLPITQQLKKIIDGSSPTALVADLIAFHVLSHIPLKQAILAETDVPRRIDRVIAALDAAVPVLELANRGTSNHAKYN
jgi:Lon protease-like protein